MIREGSLTLVPAELATVRGGPMGCMARAALDSDVTVADLAFGEQEDEDDEEIEDDDDEVDADALDRSVEVRFLANETPVARRVITRWAARAGHRWIWFRDELVDLHTPREIDGQFVTTCPTCGLEISDSGPELMKFVHAVGHFPLNCFVCGAFVPQWEPVRRRSDREDRIAPRGRRGHEVRRLRAVDLGEPRD